MIRFGRAALAVAALAGLAGTAQAVEIYDLNGTQDYLHTQVGFNYYLLGDDVTATAPAGFGYQLDSITARFGTVKIQDGQGGFKYGSGNQETYTPSLQLNVYAIDPTTRLPLDVDGDPLTADYLPPIATATRTDVTFTPEEVADDFGVPTSNSQEVTFSFAPGTILPEHFAFGYRDNGGVASDGDNFDELNFFGIIGTESNAGATTGSTVYGSLLAYANDVTSTRFVFDGYPAGVDGNETYGWSVDNNALASVNATLVAVPEPASLGLLGLGALGLIRRRKNA